MSTHQARMVIPDHWADIGRCPICNMPTLHVACQTGQPDQMACSSCGCGFEIAIAGPDIRMTWISPEYKQRLHSAEGVWLSAADIRRQMTQPIEQEDTQTGNDQPEQRMETSDLPNQQPILNEAEITPVSDSSNQEEVTRRAIGLAELGNDPVRIRSTLARSSISEEMIQTALDEIRTIKEKKSPPGC